MTLPGDPPAVRTRALARALRSRGTFQIVLGGAALAFAVIAAVQGAEWWTAAIGAAAGMLLVASGAVAWRIAGRRLAVLERGETDAAAVAAADGTLHDGAGRADDAARDDGVSGVRGA